MFLKVLSACISLFASTLCKITFLSGEKKAFKGWNMNGFFVNPKLFFILWKSNALSGWANISSLLHVSIGPMCIQGCVIDACTLKGIIGLVYDRFENTGYKNIHSQNTVTIEYLCKAYWKNMVFSLWELCDTFFFPEKNISSILDYYDFLLTSSTLPLKQKGNYHLLFTTYSYSPSLLQYFRILHTDNFRSHFKFLLVFLCSYSGFITVVVAVKCAFMCCFSFLSTINLQVLKGKTQ